MRFIGAESGRVAQFFPVEELRPIEGVNLRNAIEQITEHFGFIGSPDLTDRQEVDGSASLRFDFGSCHTDEGEELNVTEFQIYSDGIVAQATTTNISSQFLKYFFGWAELMFGFRKLQRPPQTIYTSALVVEFDLEANTFMKQYDEIGNIISQKVKSLHDITAPVQLKRLGLQSDPSMVPMAELYSEFILERRVNSPYNHQRFYSVAPFPTDDHLAILQDIETIMLRRH